MKKSMKRLTAILCMSILGLSLVGCGADTKGKGESKQESVPSDETQSKEINIGVVLKDQSEQWVVIRKGIEKAAEDKGVEVNITSATSQTDFDGQNNQIENFVASGKYDALIIGPNQPDSMQTILGNSNLPVVFVDTDAECTQRLCYCGTGNYNAGLEAAKYSVETLGKGKEIKNVVVLAGVQGHTTSEERTQGFVDGLKGLGIEPVAVQNADWTADIAAQKMESILSAQKNEVDLVLCANDAMAAGVIKVLQSAKLTDVIVTGFDANETGITNVLNGTQSATFAQASFDMGYQAVVQIIKHLNGEQVEPIIDTGVTIVTKENAEEFQKQLKEQIGGE